MKSSIHPSKDVFCAFSLIWKKNHKWDLFYLHLLDCNQKRKLCVTRLQFSFTQLTAKVALGAQLGVLWFRAWLNVCVLVSNLGDCLIVSVHCKRWSCSARSRQLTPTVLLLVRVLTAKIISPKLWQFQSEIITQTWHSPSHRQNNLTFYFKEHKRETSNDCLLWDRKKCFFTLCPQLPHPLRKWLDEWRKR